MARVASLLLTVIVAAAASLLLLLAPSAAELTRVEHPPKNEGSLAILAVGDWGRRGQFNQTLVAQQVAENGHHDAAFNISVIYILSTKNLRLQFPLPHTRWHSQILHRRHLVP